MNKLLHALIVEDSKSDALLIVEKIKSGGYKIVFERIETEDAMKAALDKGKWDIILADYKLPHFSAFAALDLVQKKQLDIPFIVISGTIGEETAVAMMKKGAHDYLMKSNLSRLCVAIDKEIKEAQERSRHNEVEQRLSGLSQVIESLSDGIGIANLKGIFVYGNSAWAKMHGYQVDDLIGKPASMLDTPEGKKNFPKVWEQIKKNGYWRGEIQRVRKDGSSFPSIMTSSIVTDGNDKQVGIVGTCMDITERKKAETKILESKIKLQVLYESSSDAIMLLDEKGFFDCNKAALRLFGCTSKEEFCSKHPADFSPPTQPNGTDSMDYARNNIAFALKEGSMRFEHLHRRLDGADFPAEVLLDKMVLQGKEVLQARVFDITERKKGEEKIRRMSTIVEQAAEGVAVINIEGDIQFANYAWVAMHGYTSSEELIGKHVGIFHTKEQLENEVILFNVMVKQSGYKIGEVGHMRKDGTTFPTIMTTTLLKNEQGKPYGFAGFAQDITEKKKAETELQNRLKELEIFYKASIGREERILELKNEIKRLTEEPNELKNK